MSRPLASLSVDLDNLWAYMKIHGDEGWQGFPSYLGPLAEIVVERLARHGLCATLFVVGQDAALDKNRGPLAALARAGHEIGNHSFSHEPWLHEYGAEQVESEIAEAEAHIERATGQRPRGFRGPGYSLSPDVLRVLARRGYLYDASTFPTFIGPLARAYYFRGARGLSDAERARRSKLYGTAAEGLRPIRPYAWRLGDHRLVEIPVTTMPIVRLPFHLSYLVYLAARSERLAMAYLSSALALLRATGSALSFLVHSLDFLGGDRVRELAFFPGMRLSTERKLAFFDRVIDRIRRSFELVTIERHARQLLDEGALPERACA